MKPKIGPALLITVLLHAALFSAVAFWPKPPAPVSEPDFTARVPFFAETPLDPPEPQPLAQTFAATRQPTMADGSPPQVGSGTCPVHQTDMTVLEVFLEVDRDGRVIDPPGLRLSNPHDPPGPLRAARFPNSRSWAWGNEGDARRNARIFICKECERAEQEWRRTQGR